VLLGIAVFGLSLAFGAVLHLRLPSARETLRKTTEQFLNVTLRGHFSIGKVSRLDPLGLTLENVRIEDPEGRLVISAPQLEARFDLLDSLVRLVRGYEKQSLVVDTVGVTDPEVFLFQGTDPESGAASPSLIQTFEPRTKKNEPSAKPSTLRFWFANIDIHGLRAESRLPNLDQAALGANLRGHLLISGTGTALDIDTFKATLRGPLEQDVDLSGHAKLRFPGSLDFGLDYRVAETRGHEQLHYEAGRLHAEGTTQEITPALVREFWKDWPLDQTIDIGHELDGLLPRLAAQVEIRAGDGVLKANGRLRLAPEIEADFDLDTEHLDLRALSSAWPETNLDLRSAVEIWGAEGHPVLNWNATVLPGQVQNISNPAVDVSGSYDDRGLLGELTIHERGLPLHIGFEQKGKALASFNARLKRTHLEQSPRIQEYVRIQGQAEGTMAGTWDGQRLVLLPNLNGRALRYANNALGEVTLRGRLSTLLKAPEAAELDLNLQGKDAALGSVSVEEFSGRIHGPYLDPQVMIDARSRRKLELHVEARTRTDRLDVRELKGEVRGDGKPLRIEAKRFAQSNGQYELVGLLIESTGRLTADAAVGPRRAAIELDAEVLDLGRIARVLELPPGSLEGKLSVAVHGHVGSDSSLTFGAQVHRGGWQGIVGASANVQGGIQGRHLAVQGAFDVEELGQARLEAELDLADSPLIVDSLPSAIGRGSIIFDGLELPLLSRLAGTELPIDAGQGTVTIRLSKPSAGYIPTARIDASTEGIVLEDASTGLNVQGVNLRLIANLDPESDELRTTFRLEDSLGDLVSISGKADLPLSSWNEAWPSFSDVQAVLKQAQLSAVLGVPERDLRDLPHPLADWLNVDGTLKARGVVRGAASAPEIEASLELGRLRGTNTMLTEPVGVLAQLRYQPESRRLSAALSASKRGSQVATGNVDVELLTPASPVGWTGEAQLQLDDAPLDLISALNAQKVTGRVQGAIAIHRSKEQTNIESDFSLRGLSILGQPLGSGRVQLATQKEEVTLKAKLDDGSGSLDLGLMGRLRPTRWAVELDSSKPLVVHVIADRYDAAVLGPPFAEVLTDLRGSLQGKLDAEFELPQGEEHEAKAKLRGQLRLTSGSVTPARMGLKLEDLTVDMSVEPAGEYNVVRLSDIRAKARSQAHNLKGKGILYFRGLTLKEGRLNLSQEALPILSEGSKLAELSGQLSLALKKTESELVVDLTVPNLEAVLPPTTDRSLIDLKENSSISVLGPRRAGEAEAIKAPSAAGMPIVVNVHLGDRVRVKSPMLSIRLYGDPVVRLDDTLNMRGQIKLAQGGRIEVLGRVFIVEHGTVFFDQEVDNPIIDTSATWRAPNGVLVRAALTGRVQNPTLEWRSDPPLRGGESEIIALVLGASTGGTGNNSGLAYGAAALNQLLGQSGVQGVGITAGTESNTEGQAASLSDSGWSSFAAAVQISDEVWFEGKYTRETSGSDPREGFSGTVDWRFHPSWSARTEIGTLGLGADLLWQYRY
jgi:hypothetical protein